jgi:hypothetical protein
MTTMFGLEAKLTVDLNGEPFDITHLIEIDREGRSGFRVDASAFLRAVEVEREVRRRVAAV